METLPLAILALIQGLTEFLPISSSAHLILAPALTGWPDQGLAFDVAVHVGSLLAVLLYFRRQVVAMAGAWFRSLLGKRITPEARLAWLVILATLPVAVCGALFKDAIENQLRSPLVVAVASIVFALLLGWADAQSARRRDEYAMGLRGALFVGLAQALALIPGTSRSGVTITAGLALGLTREAAARFSFLLSIPAIAGSGLLLTKDLWEQPAAADWNALLIGTLIAAVSAYLCIHAFLRLIERIGMWPFVLYRLLLGGALLLFFW